MQCRHNGKNRDIGHVCDGEFVEMTRSIAGTKIAVVLSGTAVAEEYGRIALFET
ncbi:MAG: hypothetical protein ACI9BW_000771 [Gammaproteobacteria bacterium]|jgi:hypothetical protein